MIFMAVNFCRESEGFGDECGDRSHQTAVHTRQDPANQWCAVDLLNR
jgi:hypothetical protein